MAAQLLRPIAAHLRDSLVPVGRNARVLGLLHLADAIGKGLFLSASAIYFITVKHLTAGQIALGFSAAGLSGFAASLVLGVVADRVRATRLLFLMLALQALGFMLYPLVGSAASFYLLITCIGIAEYGGGPPFASIVASLFEQESRVRVRATLRSIYNVGFSLGSGMVALAVLIGPHAIRSLPILSGILLATSAILTLRLPSIERLASRSARLFGAVRNPRFLSVVCLSTPLASHASIILVALPLWVVSRTEAPRSVVPLVLIANTVLVVLFQVKVSAGAESVPGAARVARRAGMWLAAGCLVVTVTSRVGGLAAAVLVCVAVALLTMAELQQSASAWGLAHGLAPEDAQAEYVGAFNLHSVAQGVFGPSLLVAAFSLTGSFGWVLIAAVVLGAAVLIVPAAAAADRSLAIGEAP